jgi:glutathione synthase/RimK-type ligase-like ATP-grasp enzyme
MRIAIHHSPGTFSERWLAYCERTGIPCRVVDCYRNDILEQLEGCTALMWHFHHANPKSVLFAKQLMYSLQQKGLRVFPDFHTCWHFDDKIGQKYLLSALGVPSIPTYIFYTKKEALAWSANTTFPKVFKLSKGAGSANVRLIHSRSAADRLIRQAFGRGFSQYDSWASLEERFRKFRKGYVGFYEVIKGFIRIFHKPEFARMTGREKGYVYFQDFIPNNDSDIRIIVIDNKAFAIKRMIREKDFRASGSGNILYDERLFDPKLIAQSLQLARQLNLQCVAYDYVFSGGEPLLIEISYGFATGAYDACTGYWDSDLKWHPGPFKPQEWMVDCVAR